MACDLTRALKRSTRILLTLPKIKKNNFIQAKDYFEIL